MREPGPKRLYYDLVHFNVYYQGSGIDHRVGPREIKGLDPVTIEWIYIVEQTRRATAEEVKQLCKGTWKVSA